MTNEEIYSYKKKTKVLLKKGTKQLLIGLLIHILLIIIAIFLELNYPEMITVNSKPNDIYKAIPYLVITTFIIAWLFMWLNFKLKGAVGLHANQIHK